MAYTETNTLSRDGLSETSKAMQVGVGSGSIPKGSDETAFAKRIEQYMSV